VAVYGFDIETHGTDPFDADFLILTAALYGGEKGKERTISAVLDHPLASDKRLEQDMASLEEIQAILADERNTIVGHRLVIFDVPGWESVFNVRIKAQWFDTHVAQNLIDENVQQGTNTLDEAARRYGLGLVKNEDNLNRKRLAEAPPELVLKYNEQDSKISYSLYAPMRSALDADGLLPYMDFQMWVGRTLTDATLTGMHVDMEWAEEQSAAIQAELAGVEKELHELIGQEINLRSPKQLAELLYGFFGFPVLVRTPKTGNPSTSEEALIQLRDRATLPIAQEFLDLLLKDRELEKLDGTYLRPLTTKHRGRDKRVHTSFNLAGAVTGRLSSSGPNLQNIPRDKRVKGVLAATPGMRLFNADYSQLELRVAGWYSGEPLMLKAFADGLDVHSLGLAEMEGIDYEYVIDQLLREETAKGAKGWEWTEKRALVKRVNFGVLYGVQARTLVGLMRDMGIKITLKRAQEIIAKWFAKYVVMAAWIESVQNEALETGYVLLPTGRMRRLPNIDPDTGAGQRALRQAVNAKVQSLAGDIGKCAVAVVGNHFEQTGGARVLVPVHDSVVGEYYPEDWPDEELSRTLTDLMVTKTLREMNARFGLPETIPLTVDVKVGTERWA
jgi:DNA polymerase I